MVAVHEVEAQIDETIDVARRAFEAESSTGYQAFNLDMARLEGLAREAFQARLDEHLWPLVNKLEEGEALTTAEQDMLKMMVVGEASYYVKRENDLQAWQDELQRLLQEIRALQKSGLDDIDSLLRLRALCREAQRVLPDLLFYYQEKERVQRFEEATSQAIDTDSRRTLANLLKDMLTSDQM